MNIIFRFLQNGVGTRESLPANCPEYIGVFKAIRVAFIYQKKTLPMILKRLELHKDNKTIYRITSHKELKELRIS
ncbi:MAG: hypothetical protein HOE90_15740 [Bacteriovoracaceae bacterium]|nr:hypothetical protein [Bacteriovoracaceae bacterium]